MWIEFFELDFKLFVLLIFPIFYTVENYTSALYLKENEHSFLFFAFNNFVSYTFSFIFLLISHYRSKPKILDIKSNDKNEDKNNDIVLNNNITMNQTFTNSKKLSLTKTLIITKDMSNEIDELKKKINKK